MQRTRLSVRYCGSVFMSSMQLTKNAKNTSVPQVLFVHLINSMHLTKNAKNTSVHPVLWVRLYELNAANKECKEHVCPSGTVCPSL